MDLPMLVSSIPKLWENPPKSPRSIVVISSTAVKPPTNLNHRWWWDRTAPLLNSLLSSCGSYTEEQRAEHMRVFRDVVIPTFGLPTPQAKVKPLLSYDGSPFEPSWNFNNGESIIRY